MLFRKMTKPTHSRHRTWKLEIEIYLPTWFSAHAHMTRSAVHNGMPDGHTDTGGHAGVACNRRRAAGEACAC